MFTEKDFKVTLENKEEVQSFIKKHGEFACICYDTPKERAEKVGEHCLKSGHFSGSRHLYFVFTLDCIPRFTIDQLVRHEVGIVKNVQSLRYVHKDLFNIYCPPEIKKDFKQFDELKRTELYLNSCYRLIASYVRDEERESKERANEVARTILPIGIATKCSFACNLEGLINLSHKRLCTRAELPIRCLVNQMVEEVIAVEPRYASLLVPQCVARGKCTEQNSCGSY